MENLLTILFLVFLEGILSFDNALALAALVKNMPDEQQKRALTYGIFGAFGFRFLSLFAITALVSNPIIRAFGGGYLVALAVKHALVGNKDAEVKALPKLGFIKMIVMVELTDIAFSIDSILASAAVSQKLWVVFTGGVLGIIMMRFSASLFIKLIKRFPDLEDTAFMLVFIVGQKLFFEALGLVDYSTGWIHGCYVTAILLAIASGFLCSRKSTS